MAERRATLIGGPKDGEVVPVAGSVMFEPIPAPPLDYPDLVARPFDIWTECHIYDLQRGSRGREYYVLRPRKEK